MLYGLQDWLLTPELTDVFVREYTEEVNRIRAKASASHAEANRRRTSLETQIGNLVDSVAAGRESPALLDRLEQREAELDQIKIELTAPPPDPVRIHPNIASYYVDKVRGLRDGLTQADTREEASGIIRGLVDEIRLHPIDGKLQIELKGDLATLVGFADQYDPDTKKPGSTGNPGSTKWLVAGARNDMLAKPQGALGKLEDLALWLAAWQGREIPELGKVQVLVFAGNHGVVAQGVSAFPAAVTAQMVGNFAAGDGAINQLCAVAGAELKVLDMELDNPTVDFTQGPALSWEEFLDAFRQGMAQVDGDADLVCIGEMGIGNTTVAAALSHALYGGQARDWTGRGTGVDDAGLARKAQAVAKGRARHEDIMDDPLEIARCLGGRELAAMAGAALAARRASTPVLIDGYVASAALAPLYAEAPDFLAHCWAAHVSAEPGHIRLLQKMGLLPLLDLGMRLGEASGAATAILLLRAGCATHAGMASFAASGVAEKSD